MAFGAGRLPGKGHGRAMLGYGNVLEYLDLGHGNMSVPIC